MATSQLVTVICGADGGTRCVATETKAWDGVAESEA